MKKDHTVGSFRKWCKKKNKDWDGCTKECIDIAIKIGDDYDDKDLKEKAVLARTFCLENPYRK